MFLRMNVANQPEGRKAKMKFVLIIEIRERGAYNMQFNIFVNNEEHYCHHAFKMQAGWHGL